MGVTIDAHTADIMKVQVTIITPFAQIDGTLECPEKYWMRCSLSANIFPQLRRLTDYNGVYNNWHLKLYNLQSFLGLLGKGIDDIWLRFRTTQARIQVDLNHVTESLNHIDTLKSLVSNDDEVVLGDLVTAEQAPMLHLTISLMSDEERMVDDSTVRFCCAGPKDICCICLDQMRQVMCSDDYLVYMTCMLVVQWMFYRARVLVHCAGHLSSAVWECQVKYQASVGKVKYQASVSKVFRGGEGALRLEYTSLTQHSAIALTSRGLPRLQCTSVSGNSQWSWATSRSQPTR